MRWKIYDKTEDTDAVKAWALYIVMSADEALSATVKPFAKGFWFFGTEDGDPGGKRLYEEGWTTAQAEVERLNRLGKPPDRESVTIVGNCRCPPKQPNH